MWPSCRASSGVSWGMVIGISVAPMPRFDLTGATELLHGEADDDDPSSARTVVAGMLIADCASAKTRRHARTHDRTAHRDSLDARRGGRRWRRMHSGSGRS